MNVHDAGHVIPRGVDAAVDGKAGGIDPIRRVHHLVALEIDFDQR
jgi:hypothetical protein